MKPALAPLLLLAACGVAIEGDVYVRTQSGETRQGTGLTVHLLADADSLRGELLDECGARAARFRGYVQRLTATREQMIVAIESRRPLGDLEAVAAALLDSVRMPFPDGYVDSMRSVVLGYSVDTAETGIAARYRFTGVRPGQYQVFAEIPIGDTRAVWLEPVTVAGEAVALDLGPSSVSEILFCEGVIAASREARE